MKLSYNSPVILTYSLISVLILFITGITHSSVLYSLFTSPSGALLNPVSIFRLFSHVMGHSNWNHLIANLTMMLLIGPLLEEKYGSYKILELFTITALVTGIINYFLFSTCIHGGSGLVFTLILLSSFANFKSGSIPLTLVLVAVLFLGQEVLNSFKADNISQFAHIAGGLTGSVYGFFRMK
ncbi:MAG: rhomboid family intramembrane serine protease [Deltaproteobacteria bacterium]|nr:MAG: rhomboid family intramembrane serine protease [Deltaproteobacteria bacterium]